MRVKLNGVVLGDVKFTGAVAEGRQLHDPARAPSAAAPTRSSSRRWPTRARRTAWSVWTASTSRTRARRRPRATGCCCGPTAGGALRVGGLSSPAWVFDVSQAAGSRPPDRQERRQRPGPLGQLRRHQGAPLPRLHGGGGAGAAVRRRGPRGRSIDRRRRRRLPGHLPGRLRGAPPARWPRTGQPRG